MTRTMFRSTPSFIWATLFLPRLVLAVTPCYAPNGSEMDSRFIPCIAVEGVHSMCCRLNDTDPDICDPTGLCYWPRTKMYYRDFCTERSFDSPNCLSRTMCDAEAGGSSNYTSPITLCQGKSGHSFCCGESNECCTDENEFTLEPTLVAIGSTATSKATATETSKRDTGSSKNVAIGVGVGVPLGILAIAMLGVGFWWGRKNTSSKYKALQNGLGAVNSPGLKFAQADSQPIHEIDAAHQEPKPSELPGS